MSLYDGKTLEADYRQLIEDNLRKLEREAAVRESNRVRDSGYFQVIDGILRYVELVPSEPVKRDENRRKDSRYRSSLKTANADSRKRARTYRVAGKAR